MYRPLVLLLSSVQPRLDKKDIIYTEIEACERPEYTLDERDKTTVVSEIRELKIALDLLA
ncbi:MAG: hypothetical protein WB988_03600 [Candidatus Nitrosopolaris sp.]|jgi:hypothetical protein